MRRRSWLPRAARAPRDHSRGRGRGLALLRTRRLSVIRRATPTSLLPFRCGLVGVRALSPLLRAAGGAESGRGSLPLSTCRLSASGGGEATASPEAGVLHE